MIKALYLGDPDFDYIEKSIESGINTLICTTAQLPGEPELDTSWNFSTIEPVLERYKDDNRVNLLFCPLLIPLMEKVPVEEGFFDGKKYLSHTYCPSKKRHLQKKIKQAVEIADKYRAGLIYDTEEYTADRNPELLKIYTKSLNEYYPHYKCKCPTCSGLSKKDQWKKHVNSIREVLANRRMSGQLPSRTMWFNKAFPNLHFFTEDTYMTFHKFYVWFNILVKNFIWGNRMKLFAGIWVERFSADELLSYIKLIGKSSLVDGYWLYPQTRFSKYSRFSSDTLEINDNYGPYRDTLIDEEDPNFFIKLKKLNKELDEYRKKSLWFKFLSIFKFWKL